MIVELIAPAANPFRAARWPLAMVVALVGCSGSASTETDSGSVQDTVPDAVLESETWEFVQSWSQETDFARTVHVDVPDGEGPFPVAILLHGNGGEGQGLLRDIDYLPNHIRIAPDGYERSWNIFAEASKAPDVDLVRAILARLEGFSNVDEDRVDLLGISNGSALVNRLLIEVDDPRIHSAVSIVSPLTTLQYRDGQFFGDPENTGAWDVATQPAAGRRLCNVSGADDPIVPYGGGTGVLGYVFLPGEASTWTWASHFGAPELAPPPPGDEGTSDPNDPNLRSWSWLDGDVVHYKVLNTGHNAGGVDSVRAAIGEFLAP